MIDKLQPILLLLLVAIASVGCDREPPEETVFDDQVQALDKARAVENRLQQRAGELEKRLDPAAEDDPPE